jgi:ribulose-bisphosphate carboxylase large chain
VNAVERIECVYRVRAGADAIEARAQALALEQSVELPLAAIGDVRIRDTVAGRVESIAPAPDDPDAERIAHGAAFATGRDASSGERAPRAWSVTIGLAASTTGAEPGQILNMLFGNASLQPEVTLVDARLPASVLDALPGPAFGVEGLRKLAGAGRRPLSCTALKPQGLAPEALAALAHTFAAAGIDLIKDDHGIADQADAPFARRVPAIQRAVQRANAATGGASVYAPSLSGGPARLAAQLRIARDEGVRCVLACPMLLGVATFAELVRGNGDVAVLAHPALAGAARIAPALLLGRLFRLFGADATIFPNFGGRFSYSRDTCRQIVDAAREPLGAHLPAMPVPAGGMSVERVDEMVAQFGHDLVLLIGGNLLEAGAAMPQRARAFADRVRQQ